MTRFRSRTVRGAAILFSGLLMFGVTTLGGEATAVQEVGGNPSCSALGYEYGYKVENPSGTYTVDRDGMVASMTVGTYADVAHPNHDNAVLAYSVDAVADWAIVVKAGPAANVYTAEGLEPLHAPVNPSGKWPTISHLDLCWNGLPTGDLEVTKDVVGVETPGDFEFEICVTPLAGGDSICTTVVGDGVARFDGLTAGDYVVTETDPGPTFTVTGSGVTVTVPEDGTGYATVTNTWIEQLGRVEVTKAVAGDGAPADVEFEVCLEPIGDTPGDTVCFEALIGDGETATFTLPPGEYQVTEPGLGERWTMTSDPETVVVVHDGLTEVALTNTYEQELPELGSVVVTKTLVGEPPAATYEICLVGPAPADTEQCRLVTGAGEVEFVDLALGTYTVTETDPGEDYTVTITPTEVEVVAGGVATATVVNDYETQEVFPPTAPTTTPTTTPTTAPTTTTTTTTVAPATTTTTTAIAPSSGSLPKTGTEGEGAVLATLLVATGAALTAVSRRRTRRTT